MQVQTQGISRMGAVNAASCFDLSVARTGLSINEYSPPFISSGNICQTALVISSASTKLIVVKLIDWTDRGTWGVIWRRRKRSGGKADETGILG